MQDAVNHQKTTAKGKRSILCRKTDRRFQRVGCEVDDLKRHSQRQIDQSETSVANGRALTFIDLWMCLVQQVFDHESNLLF